MFKIRFTIISFFFASSIFSSNFYDDFVNHHSLSSAHIGFYFYNISKGEELASYQANKSFIPASVLKMFSTAFALEVLKEDYKFSTEVLMQGKIRNDTLRGNLIIKPSFDPSLSFKDFVEKIFRALENKSIKVVKGKILFDNENLILSELPQSWLYEDIANYYGSQIFPFNVDENIYTITFRQAKEGMPCSIESIAPNVDLLFNNQVIAGASNSGDKAYILGSPFSKERKVVGTIPAGNGLFSIKGAVSNPNELFKTLALEYFQNRGITILNQNFTISDNREKLIVHKSNSLSFLLKKANQKSLNLYAEALLMAAANKQGAKNYKEALGNLDLWFQAHHLSTKNISIYDACGLSRLNSLTPKFTVEFLLKINDNTTFKESLAISGVSGTLKYFTSAQLRGNLRAKSGSSNGILNYAGFFENRKGETIGFSIMINQHNSTNSTLRRLLISFIEQYY